MGGCCGKDNSVVPVDGDHLGGPVHAEDSAMDRANVTSPNLFSVLKLRGLDLDGVHRIGSMTGGTNEHGATPGKDGSPGKDVLGSVWTGKDGIQTGVGLRGSAASSGWDRKSMASTVWDDGQSATVDGDSCVKVAVLVRPLLEWEQGPEIVQVPGPGTVCLPAKANGTGTADIYRFEMDAVYRMGSDADNRSMLKLALRVAEKFCGGFNGSVLAYGQTGSGKTYTMGTARPIAQTLTGAMSPAAATQGVIPCMLRAVLSYALAAKPNYDIVLKVQYLEIYNENLGDLLLGFNTTAAPGCVIDFGTAKDGNGRPDVRETPQGDVEISGCVSVQVTTLSQVAAVMAYGSAQRATASHKMNEVSSRSHAIFSISMEQRARSSQSVPRELQYLRSRLHLVDLAGSERQKDTGAEGARFVEGVAINKGLSELGNVINALTEGKARKHIPYRNSKLTRVLQDSLGGSAETLMLACISPAQSNHESTLNTLRYAQRARAIQNKLRLNNQQTPEQELAWMRLEMARLQAENTELRNKVNQLEAHK
eukprot:CAMPEP_0119108272 /NCGR_PEP_ID=MMETSP1180-20130426/13561_1 /TAXON_ID=3052 ORGANISM="Chlamydomonas cf sp, Strain CCMP681" /NCGR_SAMPLE_ID=MMETSP1180 /ASSEMBLY_ACC=CAM_ASM_000741 /LENGTH=536 /DNA_ID=CAMNT_0007093869 /DNA_START=67 /DNA_END=1677 /DNA_ORIENTATION=-